VARLRIGKRQVLENLSRSEAEKSAGMLVLLISIFSVRKV